MKHPIALLLASLLLAAIFAGCSASANMTDPYANGYSNVSTTHDGRVNGTNTPYSAPGAYGYSDSYPNSGAYHSSAPGSAASSAAQSGRSVRGSYTGTTSGTGMAGSR